MTTELMTMDSSTYTWVSPSYTTVTGTAFPTALTCGSNITETAGTHVVKVAPVNNATWPYITKCCKGAPIVIQPGIKDCEAQCEAGSHAGLLEMMQCYKPNGEPVGGIKFVSFLDHEITTPSTTPTPTSSTSAGSTRSPSPSTTGNAAANSRPQGVTGKMEVFLAAIVGVSLLAGTML